MPRIVVIGSTPVRRQAEGRRAARGAAGTYPRHVAAGDDDKRGSDAPSGANGRGARAWPSSAATCPTGPASTSSGRRGRGDLRRQGALAQEARRQPLLQPGDARRGRDGRPGARHRVPAARDRGRGAARRAEPDQAPPAAVQHPPARRQELPVHRDLDGRGLPARLLHARAPPPQARVLRPVLQRQAHARDARRAAARSSCSAPARARSRGGARGSPCLDFHINRCGAPCVGYVTREQYMESIDGVVAFLSGRYREIERDSSSA